VDLNAPAPFVRTRPGEVRKTAEADATRPIVPVANGYRRIVTIVNEGAAYYNGLRLELRKRFTRRFSARASYTWSHALGTVEADAPQQDPNDSNLLGRNELASGILDQRHRLVVSGWYALPWRITLGTLTTLASGRPFNVTTGVDNNADGSFADRPALNGGVIARDLGKGTPLYDVSLFAAKEFQFGDRLQLCVRGESFNVFNRANIVGRNGVYGNQSSGAPVPTFGQALPGVNNVEPGREFQFLLRLRF